MNDVDEARAKYEALVRELGGELIDPSTWTRAPNGNVVQCEAGAIFPLLKYTDVLRVETAAEELMRAMEARR